MVWGGLESPLCDWVVVTFEAPTSSVDISGDYVDALWRCRLDWDSKGSNGSGFGKSERQLNMGGANGDFKYRIKIQSDLFMYAGETSDFSR